MPRRPRALVRRIATTARSALAPLLVAALVATPAGCTVDALPGTAVPARSAATGPTSGAPSSTGPDLPAPSNVTFRRLSAGERPPQFILFSFDGVGVSKNWDLFLDTARRVDARFTALMTGLYFLTDEARARYRGPGHRPGEAAIAFGGSAAEVRRQIDYLNRTWLAGHELGTHYVGHFCRGTRYPGARWSTADWNHELDQFFSLMRNWRVNTGIETGPDLLFGADAVHGGRTQCLEGTPKTLFPALRDHGMTWDSSMAAARKGLYWPTLINGIWEFPIPFTYSPPLKHAQTALDYNYWYTFNGAVSAPKDAPAIRRIVRESYDYMYRRAFAGNRAPIVIANHFNEWSGNAFNPATADFMAATCGRPETVCATYSDVIRWMQLQDPAVLAALQRLPPVAASATD